MFTMLQSQNLGNDHPEQSTIDLLLRNFNTSMIDYQAQVKQFQTERRRENRTGTYMMMLAGVEAEFYALDSNASTESAHQASKITCHY